jgi:glycosyltransferase involved in cell wall biosynthesis
MISEHASPLAVLGGVDAGGQNVHVAALSRALARRGHRVRVFTRRDDESLPDVTPFGEGVTVEHVRAGPAERLPKDDLLPYMTEFGRRLAARWDSDPPDVVHGHFWMSGLACLEGVRGLDLPVAETFHALGSVKRRFQAGKDTSPPERERLEPHVAREVQAVIATSVSEALELCAYGVRPDGVAVVPCGVDTGRFRPDGPVVGRDARRRVLSIGRLVERKGVETLVRAMAGLPEVELLIAGGPSLPDLHRDPQVRRLHALAVDLGVLDRVVFLGRVAHDNVPALMRSVDVVASVPWYEPFGIVPVEAMACGVPVVASAVGGHLDTVLDGVTGLLVPARAPEALSVRLRELLDDPERRAAMGRAGAAHARERYSWERIAAETEAVYEDLTAGTMSSALAVTGDA